MNSHGFSKTFNSKMSYKWILPWSLLWENISKTTQSEHSRCNHQKMITSATQWFLLLILSHWTHLSFFQASKLMEKMTDLKSHKEFYKDLIIEVRNQINVIFTDLHNNEKVAFFMTLKPVSALIIKYLVCCDFSPLCFYLFNKVST